MTEMLISKFKVKTSSYFSLNNIYKEIHDYIIQEDYSPSEKGSKFPETYMWESRTQKDGREIWVWFRPSKGGLSPFFRRKFRINIHARKIKEVEIMHQGKKLKVEKGDLEVYVFAYLEIDPGNSWQKKWYTKMLFKVFMQRIYKRPMEMHKKEMLMESNKLRDNLKTMLNQLVSGPKVPFRPSRGLGEINF